jgi:hypothetical protein
MPDSEKLLLLAAGGGEFEKLKWPNVPAELTGVKIASSVLPDLKDPGDLLIDLFLEDLPEEVTVGEQPVLRDLIPDSVRAGVRMSGVGVVLCLCEAGISIRPVSRGLVRDLLNVLLFSVPDPATAPNSELLAPSGPVPRLFRLSFDTGIAGESSVELSERGSSLCLRLLCDSTLKGLKASFLLSSPTFGRLTRFSFTI